MSNTGPAFPFAPDAFQHPLFLGAPARLQAKLEHADGLLAEYWADFRRHCAADRAFRAENVFLLALFEDTALAEARELLHEQFRFLEASDTAGDFQFHTWCRCGAVTRRAAYFDWLASRGAWTPADVAAAASAFTGFAFKHAFTVLTGRGRSSNNQALSMALNLAVTGFLFGYKHAQHPTARFLFDYGMGRLPDLIGIFPGDGYGGEGSTYTSHVNTPLAYWVGELLRQLTGQDWLDVPFRPNGTTLRRFLEIELRILSPGGLLAAWDHYGWQRGINASPFAYLARASGNPRYLSLIPALGLWPDPGYLAWGRDDQLWTLVWWPDAHRAYADTSLPGELFGWCLPRTGAALDDGPRRCRLMQVWDFCAGSIAGVGRAQVNPNHLLFDLAGEPVFEDGVPEPDTDPWHWPPEQVFASLSEAARDRFLRYYGSIQGRSKADLAPVVKGLAPGLVGAANAVVLDDEPWYWPGELRVGRPEFYAATPALQAVAADAAPFYQGRYDVTRARRSSLWTSAGVGLCLDDLAAGSDHLWTWQVYLRAGTTVQGNTARIPLASGRHVLLAWAPGPEVRLADVPGYPRSFLDRPAASVRLELRLRGAQARFAVAIVPDATAVSVALDAPARATVTVDDCEHRFVAGNLPARPLPFGPGATRAAFAWLAPGTAPVELRRSTVRPAPADRHDLSDIDEDRALQYPAFTALPRWSAPRVAAGANRLSQTDAVFAELVAPRADTSALVRALASPFWPVAVAAAEVIGRRRLRSAAPALRAALAAEHAIPRAELYPPEDVKPGARTTEDLGKRWRLKSALIVALGRLRDRACVPLLGQILRDNQDFYIVYSCAAQALGRIGGPDALAALAPAFLESEVNTRTRAEFAATRLRRPGR